MIKYAPNLLQLCITDFCQLKCKHCYFGEHTRLKEMSIEDILLTVDKFILLRNKFIADGRICREPLPSLNISGGEPMLHTKLKTIIKRIAPKFYNVKFLSNGLLYSKDVCELLCKYSNRLVYQISLDGMKESHEFIRGKNTFDKTVSNILQLKKDFPEIFLQISFNSNNINYRDILPLTEFVKTLGCDMIFFDRFVPYGNSLDIRSVTMDEYLDVVSSIEKAYQLYNSDTFIVYKNRSMQSDGDYFCGAGVFNQICVPSGDRYICSRYQIKSGNWLKDDVDTLYYNAIDIESKVLQLPEECNNCKHKNVCNGGMRCLTYALTNEIKRRDVHCYRYEKE